MTVRLWLHFDVRPGFAVSSALPEKAAGQDFHATISADDPQQSFANLESNGNAASKRVFGNGYSDA